ncbi:class II aldolase/adducin family protein [Qaidamihabitans albus]|uniref:class II aldolase/adducin family protein n=1 Tax=Qaidamihabitans albus TaxID=2795733 RepID=UPI0018F13600|nr:class II aldolase/adducin family protein [Qaidamihabitans albus]
MSAVLDPDAVPAELVELTRALGARGRDQAILAEGNTSCRLDGERIVVKTSGSNMERATAADFVVADTAPLVEMLHDPGATQADLTAALDAGEHDGRRVRASIETLVHVAVQAVSPARWVAHTHPTAVVGLLASVGAERVFAEAVYSDEAVVLADPLFVPYAEPGLALGKVVHRSLRRRFEETGELPRLVLLANHGIVAIADSAAGAQGICEMAVKSATVRQIALAAGGLRPIAAESVAGYVARGDVVERRSRLG